MHFLNVLLHEKPIGTISLLPGEKNLFAFNQSYLDDPLPPTLSLSFKDTVGDLITNIKPTQGRLPPFFSNLLPEDHLRDYLAKQAGVNPKREFFLLWVLGRDLPGAVTVKPADGILWPSQSEQSEDKKTENNFQDALFRFSLAGVQLKFSAVFEKTGGLTIPVQGIGGSWIVKLPSLRFKNVPENEYSMMTLAKKMGMDIPDVKLVSLQKILGLPRELYGLEGQALVIKRFDRTDSGQLVHMEDFAQVFNVYPDDKYGRASYRNIAEVLWLETGEAGAAEFIRRLVFNTLIGNADMHLKNWSLIYPDKRQAALSPGYDFVSTIPYLADDSLALKVAKTKRMTEFSLDELSYLAIKAGLPQKLVLRVAAETVQRFRSVWESERKHLPLSTEVVEVISKHAQTIPLTNA